MVEDDIPLPGEETALEDGVRRRVGPRRSEASTNAVLVAAYTELSEHGWRDFSVDRVAKTAKASKQTIYRWWKSILCSPRCRPASGGAIGLRDSSGELAACSSGWSERPLA